MQHMQGFVPPPPSLDPAVQQRVELARMPVPILGLVEQPALEDAPIWSIAADDVGGERVRMAVSISSILWRHPEDRDDPRNVLELDPAEQEALDMASRLPLPPWLRRMQARRRLPMLREAVRTTWLRDATAASLQSTLVDHLRHVVAHRAPYDAAAAPDPWRPRPELEEADALEPMEVDVDGRAMPAVRMERDPHAVGVAVDLGDAHLTCVVLRDDMPYVRLAFATRRSPEAAPPA